MALRRGLNSFFFPATKRFTQRRLRWRKTRKRPPSSLIAGLRKALRQSPKETSLVFVPR